MMPTHARLSTRVFLFVLAPTVAAWLAVGWWAPPWLERVTAAAVALVVAVRISRRMMAPLVEATRTARRLAAGDFAARMVGRGPAEVVELAEALNSVGAAAARRDELLSSALDDAANQRDLFYSIINASSDGLLLYDARRRLVAANQRCAELLGFSVHDLLNRDTAALQRSVEERTERPHEYREKLEAHFARPDQPHQDILIIREPRRRVLRRYSCPVTNHRGPQGRVFTYTDVTAEHDLDRMKSEFVSMASHELRTPLTSVHGALQLALTGSGDRMVEEDRELLAISLASTERLVRLVNDLLDLSKIEAGRMPFVLRPLAVPDLLEEAARGMQGFAATREVRIVTRFAPTPPIAGDRDHLLRVVTNLLSNALKHSPPGGTVKLVARTVAEGVEVAVEDEGPGIPPEEAHRLFRPFSRLEARDGSGSGTGLGLAICRAIVEQHGGRIWFERASPRGARFVFLLPGVPDEPAQPQRQVA